MDTIIESINRSIDDKERNIQKLEDTIEIIDQLMNKNVVYDSLATCFENLAFYCDQLDEIDLHESRTLPALKMIAERELDKVRKEVDKFEADDRIYRESLIRATVCSPIMGTHWFRQVLLNIE